jgi:hypothetical protein
MNNEQRMSNDNDDNITQQIEFQYPSNDDLTRINQFLSSTTFHSKDSALGLSDDQLNQMQEYKSKFQKNEKFIN